MVVYQKALRAIQLGISTDLLQKITGRLIVDPCSLTVKPTYLLFQIVVGLMIPMMISYKSSKLSSSQSRNSYWELTYWINAQIFYTMSESNLSSSRKNKLQQQLPLRWQTFKF